METFFFLSFAPETNHPIQKMKPFFALTAAAALMTLASCGGGNGHDGNAVDSTKVDTMAKETTYTVDTATSTVGWAGTMVGVKTHTGTLKFTSGRFTTKGNALVSGEFVVNMKSYMMTDTNYAADGSKQGTRAMLMGHLMSPDFFAVDSFPTAQFKVTSVNGSSATGDLTVRGRTNQETATDLVITPNADGTVKATGKLVFDRQKYGVAWKATMRDMVLSNDIVLQIDLTAKGQ